MIYLDYSATTPVNSEVLESYVEVTEKFIGNPNSLHTLGVNSKHLIDSATSRIADILKVKPNEIIYTSGASEANNTIIKGICLKYQNKGKHIITTKLEHSSVIAPISYLETLGFDVDFVSLDAFGVVDMDNLKALLRPDTILVTIASVNSEVGTIEPINAIAKLVKENSNAYFHSDMTQSIGKMRVDLSNIPLASFSAHKFYGMKGVGCIIKKDNIIIDPLIHGGKSTTIFRSGTPVPSLIVSLAKALRLAADKIDANYEYVLKLNKYLKSLLKDIPEVHINSNDYCIPHILNISVSNMKPETLLHALEAHDIYISTQTACSSSKTESAAVYAITRNSLYAKTSIRISLSHLTTNAEIQEFVKVFKNIIKEFRELNENN